MLHGFKRQETRFLELQSLLASPEGLSRETHKAYSKEYASLVPIMDHIASLRLLEDQLQDAQHIHQTAEPDLAQLAWEEIQELQKNKERIEALLIEYLKPTDPLDNRNVFIEIRAGAGGDEASLFAMELMRSYLKFCEKKRWKAEMISQSENEVGGIKESICLIEGKGVFSAFKYERGVHRVQRVPSTETQGRVHTSTVTVAILPEADEVEVTIKDTDLRVDTYRASGAGGQHVNRTDSAVRLTHLPSGLVVCCQDERSQIKNRARALKVMQSKLLELAQNQQHQQLSQERKSQVGTGDRSERIRTYNFPQSRITDHRIGFTTHRIQEFMEGDIQEVIDELHKQDLIEQQSAAQGI